ncbi:MAG: acyl-CoA desaturase [Chlamydiales bacterium]|nr:acyl-CoA desaturase [Chlamydiales bacterium]
MKKALDWGATGFLISYQFLLLLSLPFYFYYATPSLPLVAIAVALLYITGMSVTGGYHRYFSHRTYKAHPAIESFLLFFGAMAMQSSALRWAYDHRLHHAHVDTDRDPYSIKKGFWYAHFLWMLEKADPIDPKLVSDLKQNPRVMFQHRFIIPLMFGTNVLAWAFVGWLLNDYLGAFFIAVALRIFVLHHLTWFINSLAHTWGDKPFCQEQTAVNNLILSFLTFGEGYHNYHHVFAKDYRNGVRWYHFDPTKWMIWTLSKLGLVKDLRRVDQLTIKKRMVLERKALLLEKIEKLPYSKQEQLTDMVESTASKMIEKIVRFSKLYKELHTINQKAIVLKIRDELEKLHASFKEDWKNWKRLSKGILSQKPISR